MPFLPFFHRHRAPDTLKYKLYQYNFMLELKTRVREWGGSWGTTLPKDQLQKEHIKPGDEIRMLIIPKKNPLKGTFGILKFSRPVKEILHEVDKEAWDA